MIVMMAGLPGTGKSTVARALAERIKGAVLDKDVIRAALFAPSHIEYSREQDDFCQAIMLQAAAYLLGKNPSLHVILDGRTFSRRYQRERVFEFCSRLGTRWAILECVCSEQIALRRLEEAALEQQAPGHESNAGAISRDAKGVGADRASETRDRHRGQPRLICGARRTVS